MSLSSTTSHLPSASLRAKRGNDDAGAVLQLKPQRAK